MAGVTDDIASRLLARQVRMEQQRSGFDAIWQEIAERILPRKAKFTAKKAANNAKGERQTLRIYDAVPALALDRFAAAVHSLVVPRNQQWHKVKASIEELNKSIRVQRYFEDLTKRLFSARYAANFDNQVHECFYDLGAFATTALCIADAGTKIMYRSVPMYQLWFAENRFGVVDVVHRRYCLTARNAVKAFPQDRLPDLIKRSASEQPEREFEFLCVVEPREDADSERADAKGMPFVQWDVCLDSRSVVDESGHRAFPYPVSRYTVTPGDIYGRGPAELVLPDIKMLNAMNKTTMQGAELRVLPPILSHSDGVLDNIRMTPGAINHNAIDSQGRALVQPLAAGGDPGLGLEMMDQKRKIVQDAFWNTLFQILVDNPQMTATEAMLRAQEKGALLAPTASRIESEFLEQVVRNEMAILAGVGALPEMPDELLEAGAGYVTEYDSPMSRARRAEEGVGILRTFEQLTPLATAMGDQGARVFRRFNVDEAAKIVAAVNGFPAAALYTDDELAALDEQQQAQANAQTLLQAAPVAASAAKDLAQAQALAASAPSTVAPQVVPA